MSLEEAARAEAEKGDPRCKHGIRRPHECKECADEPSKEEIAAFAEAIVRECLTVQAEKARQGDSHEIS